MRKFIKAMFPLLIIGTLVGCTNSASESYNEYVHSEAEHTIPAVEASEHSEKTKENVKVHEQTLAVEELENKEKKSTSNYTYEDFMGAYALFEGKPYASEIRYAFILTDTEYIDIVPEWMEYGVFAVSTATIEKNILQVSYLVENEKVESVDLEIEDKDNSILLLNNEFRLYPITQPQLQDQNLSLPDDFFE